MTWDEQWSKEKTINKWLKPSKILIDLVEKLDRSLFKRALDIGCGAGRHVIYLASEGFETYGTDFSQPGVTHTQEWLEREGLTANVQKMDMTELPYEDGYFDLIVAYNVIYHTNFAGMQDLVKKIRSKIRPGGYLFITLKGTKEWTFGKGVEIEPNTYEAPGKGVPIHYSTEDEIDTLFSDFEITFTKHFDYTKEKTKRHHERFELILRKPESS